MDGFQAYKFYLATKLHFTQKNFDVFESKGNAKNCSLSAFERRKDRKWFELLARKFNTPQEYIQFLVASAAYGSLGNIYDLEKSFETHKEWKKNKEMMTRIIQRDIEDTKSIRDLLSGNPPQLIHLIVAGKIHIETAVALNRKMGFASSWINEKYFVFQEYPLRIMKLDKFVKYNEVVIGQLIDEKLRDEKYYEGIEQFGDIQLNTFG